MASLLQDLEVNTPNTLEEVQQLIAELYQPGPPQRIAKIQDILQRLQRSSEGWQLGALLLGHKDEKVMFFGALTLTVKLNSDSSSLSDEDARQLLGRLIGWLLQALEQKDSPLVTRKLCSTLVVYFLHFPGTWKHCVGHLMQCLSVGKCESTQIWEPTSKTDLPGLNLDMDAVLAALWFSTILAEEVGKTDSNSIKHHKFHEYLQLNVDYIIALLSSQLAPSEARNLPSLVRQDSMKCFHAWVIYSHRAFIDVAVTLEPLKSLIKPAMGCLLHDDLYEVTTELFCDVLGNYSRFLQDDDLQLLSQLLNSDWARAKYRKLVDGDFEFDSMQFGQLMLAFGDATVQDLAKRRDPATQQLLIGLGGLLRAEGYAVAEDLIFVQALEFWSTFVEVLIDSLYSEAVTEGTEDQRGLSQELYGHQNEDIRCEESRSHVLTAIEACWKKIQFPPAATFVLWDSVDKTSFNDARKDVTDLLQASYTLTGPCIFSMFASTTVKSLEDQAWYELEASLYCLGSLADCISDVGECDRTLAEIFRYDLFNVLADSSAHIPSRTKQTALSFVGQYNDYFERHTEYLPEALNFLFKAIDSMELAGTASRSIHSLCSSCRHLLIPQMGIFLQQYIDILKGRSVEGLVKERIVGGIASIIQAITTDADKVAPLSTLLGLNDVEIRTCLELAASGRVEEAEATALEILRCLASLARGLQAPNEVPIDLEAVQSRKSKSSFWQTGAGSIIQQEVFHIIEKLLLAFPNSGDVLETTCSILRAGFAESVAGPFVFLPDSVAEFVLKAGPHSSRLGAVISTACSFISSHNMDPEQRIDRIVDKLLIWLVGIFQYYGEPSNDPEIAQTGIDFIYRLLPTYLNVLMSLQPKSIEYLIMFSLKALSGRDPLPKNAAADLWAAFVSLNDMPDSVRVSVSSTLEQFGPFLAKALVHNISGHAARSELDKVCDPLKKLVVRQVRAKSWLEQAFLELHGINDKITDTEKRVFLQKIIGLRGSKQTNQVVREFWLSCRGSSFAYVS